MLIWTGPLHIIRVWLLFIKGHIPSQLALILIIRRGLRPLSTPPVAGSPETLEVSG